MDLHDLEHNIRDGLHIASLAGAAWAVVAGLGGMRDDGGRITFAPRLPAGIERVAFRVAFGGNALRVEVTPGEARYSQPTANPSPLPIGARPCGCRRAARRPSRSPRRSRCPSRPSRRIALRRRSVGTQASLALRRGAAPRRARPFSAALGSTVLGKKPRPTGVDDGVRQHHRTTEGRR